MRVIGVDVDLSKINMLSKGVVPIYEEGLDDMIRIGLDKGTIEFTSNYLYALKNSDISFITVGTPSRSDGGIDLKYIYSASKSIGEALKFKDSYHLVVIRSTVIPRTSENIIKILEKISGKNVGVDFGLCMNPEFLREGSALKDISKLSRIVIGNYDEKSGEILEKFYRDIYGEGISIIRTNLHTAEMIKYANNAFLATKISFINTIANICELVPGCDVKEVSYALGFDERISPKFLEAGLGFGGSCLPKDLKALINFSKNGGYVPKLLISVLEVNEMQPLRIVKKCREVLGNLEGRVVSILGLSFKPDTDDMRNAVSIKIIKKFLEEGCIVKAYDPVANTNAEKIFGKSIYIAKNVEDCIRNSDCAIIVTEWEEFKNIEPEKFKKLMKTPFIIDGRRIYNPEKFKGIIFKAIGLGK